MLKIRRNILLFKLSNFFAYMWPLTAVAIIYFEQITNSSILSTLAFSTYVIFQSFSEIPSGIISDKWSRKKTLLVSVVLSIFSGFCFAMAGSFKIPALLFIGAIFWGIADSFLSGTDEALIYETMQDLRKKHKYDIIFSGIRIFRYLGSASAVIIAFFVSYFFDLTVLDWI